MKAATWALALVVLVALAGAVPIHNRKGRHYAQYAKHAVDPNSPVIHGGYLTYGAYFLNISIDSLPYNVLVDTGSSNLMVTPRAVIGAGLPCASSLCKQCTLPGASAAQCLFGSPRCSADGLCEIGITYGGGSAALAGHAVVAKEVSLSGTPESLVASDVLMGVIDAPLGFPTAAGAGIVGFAYPENACNPTCIPPILDALAAGPARPPMVLGMCLTTTGGVIDFFRIDSARAAAPIVWTAVTHKRWYNIDLQAIAVGNHTLPVPSFMYAVQNDQIGSFVDSGTTVILLGPAAYAAFTATVVNNYSHLPGIPQLFGAGATGCVAASAVGDLSQYPAMSFSFPRMDAPGSSFTIDVPASRWLMNTGGNICVGVATAAGVGAVLGDVFLADQYVVYDRVMDRVGFAPLVPNSCA